MRPVFLFCHKAAAGGVFRMMIRTTFIAILFCFSIAASSVSGSERVQVSLVTDEAEAVLKILGKRQAGKEVTDADWERLFKSEGYVRLKKREAAMNRAFEDSDFRAFVLSDDLAKRYGALRTTLDKWKRTDVTRVAKLPLAYLPKGAVIRAKIYPVIKPRDNSFVFEIKANPAIFMYLNPDMPTEEFENHLAHELHHIGYGTACPPQGSAERLGKLSPGEQKAAKWAGAFGEGFAMLAAAGGPDKHPHAASKAEDRERWDRDVLNFERDLRIVEKFFTDLIDGKLTEEDERKTAFSFYGVQGPWYTVGWKMAVVIENTLGRETLVENMCDERTVFETYNRAALVHNRNGKEQLPLWSEAMIRSLK
jgi:hypothetical protein